MKLSNFYNQVRQDHGEAIQGLRYKNTLPNFKDYKSVKAISSNGETVVLMSNLGNVRVETRYYIKDKNKKAESRFFLFNKWPCLIASNSEPKLLESKILSILFSP